MRFGSGGWAIAATVAATVVATAAQAWVHPFAMPQDERYPDVIIAVIEIPAGSFTKYEIDPATGHLFVDRYQSMPVTYPANYGSIPSSLAGDGDSLDVLVLTREPIVPGAFIRVRPIGVLQMVDDGEMDDKIIAVPVSDVDPTYDGIATVGDLPAIERQRIEAFFRVYKQLPAGRSVVEVNGFRDAETARQIVRLSVDAYRRE